MSKKITMHQAIFYQLWKQRSKDPELYIPIWQLIGEVYVEELGEWGFVSYEVSPRTSELWQDNPSLFERKYVTGKSGSKYYAYRITLNVSINDIKDTRLLTFYKRLKEGEKKKQMADRMRNKID